MLTAPRPVGRRVLVLNQHAWAPDGDVYRRCDDTVGCTPPDDHCDPGWILAAVQGLDVPPQQQPAAGTTTAGCDVVVRTVSTFPRDLCQDLPATR